MPTSYKKSELVELLNILKIPHRSKYVKAEIEEILSNHISDFPQDVQLDPRLDSFVGRAAPQEAEEEDVPTEEEETEETAATEEPSAEAIVKEKLEDIAEKVPGIWSRVRGTGPSVAQRLRAKVLGVQSNISTVASVNWLLVILEYLTVIYLTWPRDVLGHYLLSYEKLGNRIGLDLLLYTGLLVVPALIFSFVVNFTKKNAIRRKKHVYAIDPILFGLTRFFGAILYRLLRPQPDFALLAGASGITSALIGIYASILQTP